MEAMPHAGIAEIQHASKYIAIHTTSCSAFVAKILVQM